MYLRRHIYLDELRQNANKVHLTFFKNFIKHKKENETLDKRTIHLKISVYNINIIRTDENTNRIQAT